MDEIDEYCRSVGRFERHNSVHPLDCIRTLKGKLFLTGQGDGKLVIPHWGIEEPVKLPHPKLFINPQITPWDGVGNYSCDKVEGYIVYAEPPYKLVNVLYMLLMWFCS